MTTTPTPSPDAVEALYKAVNSDAVGDPPYTQNQLHAMKIYVQRLNELGFTITRAAPMSEAELEREFMAKSWKEVPMGGAYLLTVEDAMAVAKKYRRS